MAYEIVVVGTSLGGLEALTVLLQGLPRGLSVPIAVVQHQGEQETGARLATVLSYKVALPVVEAEDKMPLVAGRVYLAPHGYHLLVEPRHLALSTDGPVLNARPSINVLFESAADAFGSDAIAVALTASSIDGLAGLRRIRSRGGYVIAQEPGSARSPVLVNAAILAQGVDRVVPLPEIAAIVAQLARSAQPARKELP